LAAYQERIKDLHDENLERRGKINMQTIPDSYPHQLPTSSIHRQLTPPESLPDDNNIATQRSFSDPKDDDYYFYHRGAVMTSRRSSIQSIGRVPEEDKPQPQTEQVRLPPITSLFAAVERISFNLRY